MTVYTADQEDRILDSIRKDKVSQVYLLIGERFLCRQAAGRICQALLEQGGTLHGVDGEREKFTETLQKLSSYSLFPGRQIYRVTDTRLFHSIQVAESLWKKTDKAWKNNDPARAARHLRNMLEAAGLDPDDSENDPASFSPARWKKVFGFARPQVDLAWMAALPAEPRGREQHRHTPAGDDPAALLEKNLANGLPGRNILVLTAEDVDRRKRLYKYLAEKYVVLDLGVEAGSGSRAQAAQKQVLLGLLQKTLQEFDKTISREAAELLCERVGFHPVAVVRESEKLALYVGSRSRIETADLNAIVGRTRQEALFELTDALGRKELERSLLIASRLDENGIHPLAVIATLKNFTRNLLLFKALQEQPEYGYSPTLPPAAFQREVLPALKRREQWKQELAAHPYALYVQFKTAAGCSSASLKKWLELILRADMLIKGSRIEPRTIVQHLIISMLAPADNVILQNIH